MKFLEASISMNNKRMNESDVSASVASPADYIPYFCFMLDHLVSTSIDAYAAIITVKLQQQPLYKCDPSN